MQLRSLAVPIACALALAGPAGAATLTVTDTGDAGDGTCDASCTLRDAVDAAASDDRILFDLALPAPILIGLSGGALQIDVPLRITATDGVPTTIRRVVGLGRLLNVLAGADVRIVGLGFEGGRHEALAGDTLGGAVWVAAGGALELRQCVFRDNRAMGNHGDLLVSPGRGVGGAIHADGDLLVDGCAFVDNQVAGGDGAAGSIPVQSGAAGWGGAISATGLVDILNSTFHDNVVRGGAGASAGSLPPGFPPIAGGNGGDAFGAALYFGPTATATVAFSTLIGNTASGGSGGSGSPGDPAGTPGSTGQMLGAAIASEGATVLNVSAVGGNAGNFDCGTRGAGTLTARTTNAGDDGSCPGLFVPALVAQFEPIDALAASPHYQPLPDAAVVDAAPTASMPSPSRRLISTSC